MFDFCVKIWNDYHKKIAKRKVEKAVKMFGELASKIDIFKSQQCNSLYVGEEKATQNKVILEDFKKDLEKSKQETCILIKAVDAVDRKLLTSVVMDFYDRHATKNIDKE